MASIDFDSAAAQSYIFYSVLLAVKILLIANYTGVTRSKKKVFANPEDVKLISGSKVKYDDPDVERVRRAHLNALENIPVFWVLGALYLTTSPVATWAILLFRVFAAGRIIHTFVYAIHPLPMPTRALAYIIPLVINYYMAVQVLLYYISGI